MFDQRNAELLQPLTGPDPMRPRYPDFDRPARLRPRQCLSEAGRDSRRSFAPQQPIDRQQDEDRP